MSRSLVDLGHTMLEIHVMIHCKNFAASDEWRASNRPLSRPTDFPRPLSRPTDFPRPPKRFTAADIQAHMKRKGSLAHDRRLASTTTATIHAAMKKLCHGFPHDDLRYDERTGTFWYEPFAREIEIQ